MINHQARHALTDLVLQHLEESAQDELPLVVSQYSLGSSGVVVDLAVAAEELIGFVIHIGGEPLDQLEGLLATCARYVDRVVVVVADKDAEALGGIDRAGAAIWAVDEARTLVELRPGHANIIGPAALFDLMPAQHRASLVRQAIQVDGPYDRARAPISLQQLREHALLCLETPQQRYWSALRAF